jgi:hypothetical protein
MKEFRDFLKVLVGIVMCRQHYNPIAIGCGGAGAALL